MNALKVTTHSASAYRKEGGDLVHLRYRGETHKFDGSWYGRRVAVERWSDGIVTVRAIKGDGRRSDFVEYEARRLVNPTDAEVIDAVSAVAQNFGSAH